LVKPPKYHNKISHLLRLGNEENPVQFEAGLPVFRLVQQIRDETHKTAVEYHRKRREMRDFTSELTAIEGVGDKRKLKLLRNFGSIERIAKASVEELTPFVGEKTAKLVAEHFERQRKLAKQ
jgi:excinuclease ABC subunit C